MEIVVLVLLVEPAVRGLVELVVLLLVQQTRQLVTGVRTAFPGGGHRSDDRRRYRDQRKPENPATRRAGEDGGGGGGGFIYHQSRNVAARFRRNGRFVRVKDNRHTGGRTRATVTDGAVNGGNPRLR